MNQGEWLDWCDRVSASKYGRCAVELLRDSEAAIQSLQNSFSNDEKPEEAVEALRKLQAKELWQLFGNTPINDQEEIEEPFLDFPAGTDRFEIWHWFEESFDVLVAELSGIKPSEKIDLFHDTSKLPLNVKEIVDFYGNDPCIEDRDSYHVCEELLGLLEPLGYTFDYGLDGIPTNLRAFSSDFAKLITEILAVSNLTDDHIKSIAASMDLEVSDVQGLIERAQFESSYTSD